MFPKGRLDKQLIHSDCICFTYFVGFENFFPKNRGKIPKTKANKETKSGSKEGTKAKDGATKDSSDKTSASSTAKKSAFGAFQKKSGGSGGGGGGKKNNEDQNQLLTTTALMLLVLAARGILEEDSNGNGREVSVMKGNSQGFQTNGANFY